MEKYRKSVPLFRFLTYPIDGSTTFYPKTPRVKSLDSAPCTAFGGVRFKINRNAETRRARNNVGEHCSRNSESLVVIVNVTGYHRASSAG